MGRSGLLNCSVCWLGISLICFFCAAAAQAQTVKTLSLNPRIMCPGEGGLVVISANHLSDLLQGYPVEQLSFFSLLHENSLQNRLRAIVFQIDQKDPQGRYIINPDDRHDVDKPTFLSNHDELVFRKVDLGERLDSLPDSLFEIELSFGQGQPSRWIYINLQSPEVTVPGRSSVVYNSENDSISSDLYKIGFSATAPFLVNSFHWRQAPPSGWSPDISDMMKIRHKGRFLGIPFQRTHDDYHSQLVAIKKGPLRIIRRTENRVKVFWALKTPAIYIDYVMMPNGFVMDTMIDIPFKISLFFSALETLTTMDWNNADGLPPLTSHPALSMFPSELNLKLPVNGKPSADKYAFNRIVDTQFSVSSDPGVFDVTLDIPDDFPIKSNLYIKDALDEIDPPENYPGQFGNVGFRTTGWENIDSQLHHLKFTVCISGR